MEDLKQIGEIIKKNQSEEEEDRIRWLGADGGLVLLFILLVIIEFCALYYKIDILSGYVFPGLLLVAVCIITVRYLITLSSFMRTQNQAIRNAKTGHEAMARPEGKAGTDGRLTMEEDDRE